MRTIVELPDEQVEALRELCKRERISRAEAVRRAVAAYVQRMGKDDSDEAFGLWKSRGTDAMDYLDRLRAEW